MIPTVVAVPGSVPTIPPKKKQAPPAFSVVGSQSPAPGQPYNVPSNVPRVGPEGRLPGPVPGTRTYQTRPTGIIGGLLSRLRGQPSGPRMQAAGPGILGQAMRSLGYVPKSTLAGLSAQIASLQSQQSANAATITDLESQLGTANSSVSSLQAQLASANSQISSLSAQAAPLQAQIDALNANVSSLQSQLSAANASIASLTSQLSSLQTQLANLQSEIANEQNSVIPSLQSQLAPLQQKYSGYANTLSGLQSVLAGLEDTIANLTGDVGTLQSDLASDLSSISSLKGTLGGLQSQVQAYNVVNAAPSVGDGGGNNASSDVPGGPNDPGSGPYDTNYTGFAPYTAAFGANFSSLGTQISGHAVVRFATAYSPGQYLATALGYVPVSEETTEQGDIASLTAQVNAQNAQIGSLQGQLSSAQSQAQSLQGQVTAANATVASLTAQIGILNGTGPGSIAAATATVSSLQQQLAAANASISSLNTQVATLNGTGLDAVNADYATVQGQLGNTSASSGVAAAWSPLFKDIGALMKLYQEYDKEGATKAWQAAWQASVVQLKTDLSVLQQELAAAGVSLTALGNDVAALTWGSTASTTATVAAMQQQVAAAGTAVGNMASDAAKMVNDIGAIYSLNQDNLNLQRDLQSVYSALPSLASEIAALNEGSVTSASAVYSGLQNQVSSLQSQITTLNAGAGVSGSLAWIQAQISSVTGQIGTANSTTIPNLQSQISSLTSQHNANLGVISNLQSTISTWQGYLSNIQSGDLPVSIQWSFGDGSNGSGGSVSHVWQGPGTYAPTVTISVTRPDGQVISKTWTFGSRLIGQWPTQASYAVNGQNLSVQFEDNKSAGVPNLRVLMRGYDVFGGTTGRSLIGPTDSRGIANGNFSGIAWAGTATIYGKCLRNPSLNPGGGA